MEERRMCRVLLFVGKDLERKEALSVKTPLDPTIVTGWQPGRTNHMIGRIEAIASISALDTQH